MSPAGDMGPDGPLEVVQGVDEDRIVVRADLDLSLAEPLRVRGLALMGDGRRLAIDLTHTMFLDSSGVQSLVRLATAAPDGGFRVMAGGQPYQVLELTEVLDLLGVERVDGR